MDYYAAEKLKSVGVEVPEELWPQVEGYLERRDEDARQIRQFLHENDFAAIDRVAHKVKGSGSSYGFDHFTEIADQIQKSLQANDEGQLRQSIQTLEAKIKEAKSILGLH